MPGPYFDQRSYSSDFDHHDERFVALSLLDVFVFLSGKICPRSTTMIAVLVIQLCT